MGIKTGLLLRSFRHQNLCNCSDFWNWQCGNLNRMYCYVPKKPFVGASPFIAAPSRDVIQKSAKILSLYTTGNIVSWCSITRNKTAPFLTVDNLVFHELSGKPRLNNVELLRQTKELCGKVPECDLCVFEESAGTVSNPQTVNLMLYKIRLQSLLLGLMSTRFQESEFVSIAFSTVARIFRLYVGTERVAGYAIAEDIMENEKLQIKASAKWSFSHATATQKECLASAFLLNLAYWQLSNQFVLLASQSDGLRVT